tara:strand:+ start:1085 stop:1408 length:324 start_codon:yes stop_codon:yes gene_type:complete
MCSDQREALMGQVSDLITENETLRDTLEKQRAINVEQVGEATIEDMVRLARRMDCEYHVTFKKNGKEISDMADIIKCPDCGCTETRETDGEPAWFCPVCEDAFDVKR